MAKKKQLYDKEKIIGGLVIFLILFSFPIWYNHGKAAPAPERKLTDKAKAANECVLPKAQIITEHMQLLDVWRDGVVRDTNRIYKNPKGKEFNMSLSNTCMECHFNKADFCDKCHNYTSVTPYCWDCHIENPFEGEVQEQAVEGGGQEESGDAEESEEEGKES